MVRRTFFIDPLDSEGLFTIKLTDVSHFCTQSFIADVSTQICNQHITKSHNSTNNVSSLILTVFSYSMSSWVIARCEIILT